MVTRLAQPSSNRPLLDDSGAASTQFNTWLKVITDRSMIIGEGAPDGVVQAPQGAQYMNRLGFAGSILYIKRDSGILGNETLGWVLV